MPSLGPIHEIFQAYGQQFEMGGMTWVFLKKHRAGVKEVRASVCVFFTHTLIQLESKIVSLHSCASILQRFDVVPANV